jgi:hypothetical protein
MMLAKVNPDRSVTVPKRAESADGTIGDGMVTIRPGEPGYQAALEQARRDEMFAWRVGRLA